MEVDFQCINQGGTVTHFNWTTLCNSVFFLDENGKMQLMSLKYIGYPYTNNILYFFFIPYYIYILYCYTYYILINLIYNIRYGVQRERDRNGIPRALKVYRLFYLLHVQFTYPPRILYFGNPKKRDNDVNILY